jgi:hypothetical protein
MRMLAGESRLLDTAREVSAVLRAANVENAIIGGVAVALHGRTRTTLDVDVYTADLEGTATALRDAGYRFQRRQRQSIKHGVPVQLLTKTDVGRVPEHFVEVEGIRTVSLAELIAMKLHSGLKNLLRAQDLADVIGLIRHRRLTTAFARHLPKDLRAEFRKLATAVARG